MPWCPIEVPHTNAISSMPLLDWFPLIHVLGFSLTPCVLTRQSWNSKEPCKTAVATLPNRNQGSNLTRYDQPSVAQLWCRNRTCICEMVASSSAMVLPASHRKEQEYMARDPDGKGCYVHRIHRLIKLYSYIYTNIIYIYIYILYIYVYIYIYYTSMYIYMYTLYIIYIYICIYIYIIHIYIYVYIYIYIYTCVCVSLAFKFWSKVMMQLKCEPNSGPVVTRSSPRQQRLNWGEGC